MGPNTTYSWNFNGTTTTGSTLPLTVADNMSETSKYRHGDVVNVTVNNLQGSCLNSTTASATSNPIPITVGLKPIITGQQDFCPGQMVTITAADVTAGDVPGSYQWYKESQAINGATLKAYDVTIAGNYTVKAIYHSCGASSDQVILNYKPTAQPGNLSIDRAEICNGSAVIVSGSGGLGTAYYSCSSNGGQSWDVFDHTHGGEDTFSNTPPSVGSFRYMLKRENECGQSAAVYFDLIVNSLADPVGINGPTKVYPGESYDYNAISTLNNDSFQWTAVGGAVVSSQGSSSVKVKFNTGGGTLNVSASNAKCGNSVSRSLSVSERKINFARQETVLIENINTESGIDPLTVDTKSINTTFFDGIGRLIQGLSWQSTPAKGDIVTPVVYDNFGREHRKYLPASLEGTGYYRPSLLDASGNFTNSSYSNSLDKIADDIRPFSETIFEPSPLNRPVQQFGPGQDWKDNNKYVGHQYLVNQDNEVILFTYDPTTGLVSTGAGSQPGYYAAGQLYANVTTDEHTNDVVEYTDKLGLTICKKVQYKIDAQGHKLYASTYYIYDDLSNLVVVLPPEAIKSVLSSLTSQN